MKRSWIILVFLFLLSETGFSQIYAGYNAGPLLFRTGDLQLMYYPKNEDWIAITLGGGATIKSPFLLASQKDCVNRWRNSGYHIRAGFRNGLTHDHHESHWFWGLNVIYTSMKEFGIWDSCSTETPGEEILNPIKVVSGAIQGGYSWNLLHKKTIHQKFLLDFGMQVGFPLWQDQEFLGRRQYVSGIGFGGFPIRSVHFELIGIFRWELWHNRYGYRKSIKFKH